MANSIQPAIIDAKTNLQMRFWTKLEESLDEMFKNFPNLNYRKPDHDEDLGTVNPWYSEAIIKNFYYRAKKSSYYGIIYSLGQVKDIGELFLKFEYDRNWYLYYGLRLG